jgi:hypothetical protein
MLLQRPGARRFRLTLVSFAQQDIIVAQPRHSAAPSCVCGLLCPVLSSVFKLLCCSRRVSQPCRGVRDVSYLLVGGCLYGWVCGCMFSVGWVGVYVGLCFCVYSNLYGWVCGGIFSVGCVCVYVGLCFCVYSNICLHVSACGCLSFGNLLGNLDCMFCNE